MHIKIYTKVYLQLINRLSYPVQIKKINKKLTELSVYRIKGVNSLNKRKNILCNAHSVCTHNFYVLKSLGDHYEI